MATTATQATIAAKVSPNEWSKSKDGASTSEGFTKSASIDKNSKRKLLQINRLSLGTKLSPS